MATKQPIDKFANMALLTTVESAANTLTFKKLETGISLTEKVAWVINRIEYILSGFTSANFAADADGVQFGLSVSNAFATPTLNEVTILDFNQLHVTIVGAVVSKEWHQQPTIKDFASMPSGGIIVPPTPLYGWVLGQALTSAITVNARIWYTLLELATDQYWELVEARRVLSS